MYHNKFTNRIKYTWEDFDKDISTLALDILRDDSFKPDLIIGVMRGGMIPAIALSHLLGVRVESYTLEDKGEVSNLLDLVRSSYKVLVVDEICDTGNTFLELQSKLNSIGFDNNITSFRFCCLLREQTAGFIPHYVGTDAQLKGVWIEFPWENS